MNATQSELQSKLVPCKECYEPIAKNAEVCPHCGSRIRGSRTDQLATIIFILIILGIVTSVLEIASQSAH
jgi:RNA polymerase subunit RPABC4/transcription elongation factor Spt4